MLREKGFNYAIELRNALRSDLSVVKNQNFLQVLLRLLPYTCVQLQDADATKVKALIELQGQKFHVDPNVDKQKEELNNLNNILAIEKEKKVATGG
jgi:hypothetical protein